MAIDRNRDARAALAAIFGGCVAAAAVMLVPWEALDAAERMAIAAAAGIAAAAVVVIAIIARRRIAATVAELDPVEEETPALRRQDWHPEAPPRRPIFAVSDLGVPDEPQSIPELLARFERGLERRKARQAPEVASDQAEAPADVDDALRDALGTLRQMASRVQ